MTKKYVLIVEPVSSGRFYFDAVREIGLDSIGFLPCLSEAGPAYIELREAHVARYVTPKADLILRPASDQWEDTVRLLAPFADSIAAVVVGSEIGVFEADRIARHLQRHGNAPETSALRRDKLQMQDALRRAGLPSIRSCAVRSVEEGLRFAEQLGTFPIVVKNLSGSATAGLHFCDSEVQLRRILEQELTETDFFGVRNESVLLQEMISGTEYVVNTVSRSGIHQLTDMWVYNKITVGDLGHAYESVKLITHPTKEHERIIEAAKQAITALGIEYGPAHSEIMLSPNGPVLIETGARPMGGNFPPPLLKECLGHSIVDRSLEAYLFPERFEKRLQEKYRPSKGFLGKYFISPAERKIDSFPLLPFARHMPSIRIGHLTETLESLLVDQTVDLMTTPGSLCLVHEDEEVLMRDYRLLRELETEHFHLLFSDVETDSGLEEASLDAREMQELFGTVSDPSKSNAWHITTLETRRELKESYPLWNHVRDTEFPREAVIENLVITGITPRPDSESLIDFLDKLGSQIVPGGTLTLVAGETGMTPGDWRIILRILGWDIEPGEGRFVRAARRNDG